MHEAAHAYAVERLNEAIEKVRSAGGWIGILPETTDHTIALVEAIGNQLDSVLRSVDRPTTLEDFDNGVEDQDRAEIDAMKADIEAVERSLIPKAPKAKPKMFKFDAEGDIE
jgi:hypothetical protein